MIASLYFNLDSQSSNLNIIIWCDICVLCSIIEVTKGGEKSWMIDYANFFALDSFMSVCVQLNDWIIINIQEHIHKNLRLASFFFFLVMMARDILKPIYMPAESESKSSFWMILETHVSPSIRNIQMNSIQFYE